MSEKMAQLRNRAVRSANARKHNMGKWRHHIDQERYSECKECKERITIVREKNKLTYASGEPMYMVCKGR